MVMRRNTVRKSIPASIPCVEAILADWVVEQGSIFNATSDGEAAIALTLTEKGGGTLLSSTRYVHYGRITTRRKL